jgi:hypothetical protein
LKFEVDTFKTKVIVKKTFSNKKNLSLWADNSCDIGARVMNLVTLQVVDDKEHIFEV